MNVTINKHFNAFSPFTDASNDEERAKVMRLKYPRACSNLEAGAEAFADMVKEVRQYEAWKFIGFDTFEDFCSAKLGKTIDEVEEIVEGVRILGGNPTEQQAKQAAKAASKAERIRKLAEDWPDMTRAEISRETGSTRAHVTQVLTKPCNTKQLTPKVTIRLTLDPSRTAANIRKKMGDEYARQLKAEL